MNSETPTASDPYDAVLADLRAQRARIDQTIALLEQVRALGRGGSVEAASLASQATPSAQPNGLGPGAFLGMTIVDAAKALLARERRQLSNAEIADAFKRGGLILNSAEPMNTVGSVLTRRFNQVGDVVRVGRGVWGLKEWYPNRSFKAKPEEAKPTAEPDPALAAIVLPSGEITPVQVNPPSFAEDLDDEIPF